MSAELTYIQTSNDFSFSFGPARLSQAAGYGVTRRNQLNGSIIQLAKWVLHRFGRSGFVIFAFALAGPVTDDIAMAAKAPAELMRESQAKPLSREEVDRLLQKARLALAAGKVQEAEKLLVRAEGANVRYPVLHFGDRPSRLRRELKKYKASRGSAKTASPSTKKATSPTENPFLQALEEAKVANTDPSTRAPSRGVQPPQQSTLRPLPVIAATSAGGVESADYRAAAEPQRYNTEPRAVVPASNTVGVDLSLPSLSAEAAIPLQLAQAPEIVANPGGDAVAGEQLLPQGASPFTLLQQGEQALRRGERNTALKFFRAAHAERSQLDLLSQEQLQDHLQMLSSGPGAARGRDSQKSLLNVANSEQMVVARQLSAEIGKRQTEAAQLRETDPRAALEVLLATKQMVEESALSDGMKAQLTRRVAISISEMEKYISDNKAELDLDAANKRVLDDIDREREVRLQVQQRLVELVQEYNTLRDEQRYAQAELVAKRAYDMAPEDLVAQQIWANAKFLRRTMLNREIDDLTEGGVMGVIHDIRKTGGEALVDSTSPITYADGWRDLVAHRLGSGDRNSRQTESELKIHQQLRTPVLPRYTDMPLTEVMEALSDLSGVNIHLDPRGLSQEGVRSDTRVSLSFPREISLASALTLLLEPLHLTYVIKNEVLKVTSEEIRDGELKTQTYNVADLVIPIPNFVPSSNMGLAGMLEESYRALPLGVGAHRGDGPTVVLAGNAPAQPGAPWGANILPQQMGGGGVGNSSIPLGVMPGSPGGAANADFDSLIDLIVSTVQHDTWMENGTGEGEIQPFPTNLSLVISQTQNVHEEIADLLEQLRRLQDLQVTIEVRFIRLTDSFFERIGIDFDFNIEDGTGITDLNNIDSTFEPRRSSASVGLTANPIGIGPAIRHFHCGFGCAFSTK